nr:conserved zinc-finger protein [Marseillevirus cajuinensis]
MNLTFWFLICLACSSCALACDVPVETLKQQRTQVIAEYVARTQAPNITMALEATRYYDPNLKYTIRGVGDFDTALIANEYLMVLFPLFPGSAPPTYLENYLDVASLKWPEPDLAEFYQGGTVKVNYNYTKGDYDIIIGGTRNKEYILFKPCSLTILEDYVINSKDAEEIFEKQEAGTTMDICLGIMATCTGELQQYESVEDCVQYIDSRNSPCPYPYSSDSFRCRSLHLFNSFIDPAYHCPHTGKNSMTCMDTCLPNCSSCAVNNAHCEAEFQSLKTATFSCKCNEGYVGTGGSCTKKQCLFDYSCGLFSKCQERTCVCQDTFEWDPLSGTCKCSEDSRLRWHQGRAYCVEKGKCLERTDCYAQDYTQSDCKEPVPNNPYSPFKACKCNEGFIGGYQEPCKCSGKIFWISGAQYCAQPGQCSRDQDCAWWQDCVPKTGSVFGVCA